MTQTCTACCRPTIVVYVHGHAQCQHCKVNIMPCCQGASLEVSKPCPSCGEVHLGNCGKSECPQ